MRSPLLIIVAAAMLAFAGLDIREVFHQDDEGRTGVAILAGSVAVLHLGAAIIAGFMAHRGPAGLPGERRDRPQEGRGGHSPLDIASARLQYIAEPDFGTALTSDGHRLVVGLAEAEG